MARSTYRVLISRNPDELLLLVNTIIAKHTADDTTSPLLLLAMDDCIDKVQQANALHEQALRLRRESELITEQRNLLLGIHAGQTSKTPDTLNNYISRVRSLLKGILRGQERKLGDWGFEVIMRSQSNRPRIPLSLKPEKLIALATQILQKHTADGEQSPLRYLNMTAMQTIFTQAQALTVQALQLRRDSETTTQARNLLLGMAKGQNRRTQGTILFYVTSIRDILEAIYRGSEQTLGDWGFEVNRSVQKRKEKKTESEV